MTKIPVMRPKLPTADRLAPYLKKIDSARQYSNYGPLVSALEERLAAHYGLGSGTITTVANATIGLTLALTAQGARPGTLCALPAWTFVASAHAAMMAGLIPFFVDVDPDTWALDPEKIGEAIVGAPAKVGAIMPVAPFGRPIDVAAWDRFQARARIPVVIDAAAAFDSVVPGRTPAVVSLHATKAFGVGEGGFVMSADLSMVRNARIRSNFGLDEYRQSQMPATNAKLSEYHAAVGLAMFDEWAEARAQWLAAAQTYREMLTGSNQVRFQQGFGETWVAATCIMSFAHSTQARAAKALAEAGIETRQWWGNGAHAYPATESFSRTPLPVTETLASSTIGMPFYRDMTPAEIRTVAEVVLKATGL